MELVEPAKVGEAAGLGVDDWEAALSYLVNEGLVKWQTLGSIGITRKGLKEVEAAPSQPDMAPQGCSAAQVVLNIGTMVQRQEQHLPGSVSNVFQGDVGNVAQNSQGVTQSTTIGQTAGAPDVDLSALAAQLGQLLETMKSDPQGPKHPEEIAAVERAEDAAKQGDGEKTAGFLAKAGSWTRDVATKLAIPLAVEYIKRSVGWTKP